MDNMNIPVEKLVLARRDDRIADKKLDTKPVGYFKDAFIRFKKNKSSVIASVIILALFLFAFLGPFISKYKITDRDGFYKLLYPKSNLFSWAGWDGCGEQTESQAGFDYYNSIGYEYGDSAVKEIYDSYIDENTALRYYKLKVDAYAKVGFQYFDLSQEEYDALKAYQNSTGIQVMYPMPANYKVDYIAVTSKANLWYKLLDASTTTSGESMYHDEDGKPIYVADYMIKSSQTYGKYDSIRLPGDNGGANGDEWYVYAVKNQTGYKVRVLYSEYYRYQHGHYAEFLFGTNQHGQDIFVCLANGAKTSFILAIFVSIINFIIGVVYGSVEGYYGGWTDLLMERISDILASVPMLVVHTLFQLYLCEKVGSFVALLFAFVLTGWIGIAARVRTQFYRFKNQEYVLAARTLGASDKRLIFRHIFPNSLGTIITSVVLVIPGVIFGESSLSYLGIINLETSGITSVGTLLGQGQTYLASFPHIIFFPAVFISLLEISFNLFGNGLRDAFNPSLRGVDE